MLVTPLRRGFFLRRRKQAEYRLLGRFLSFIISLLKHLTDCFKHKSSELNSVQPDSGYTVAFELLHVTEISILNTLARLRERNSRREA